MEVLPERAAMAAIRNLCSKSNHSGDLHEQKFGYPAGFPPAGPAWQPVALKNINAFAGGLSCPIAGQRLTWKMHKKSEPVVRQGCKASGPAVSVG